jgi:hypothetical protein
MPPPEYKDVLVRISGIVGDPHAQPPVRKMEVNVNGTGEWKTDLTLDLDALDPSAPEQYGNALGKQMGNPTLMRAVNQAGLGRGGLRLRLRLQLDDDKEAPHWVRWERLWLPAAGTPWRVAVHPNILFSRYIPVEQPDGDPPDAQVFRLLYAVANPEGLGDTQEINVEEEITNFVEQFEKGPLSRRLHVTVSPGRTKISDALNKRIVDQGWKVVPDPATLQSISKLLGDRFHGLHILAHGDFNPQTGTGRLLLEDETGKKQDINDTELQSWITPDLQLVVFQACNSAATQAEGRTPFTGLAPSLVRLGVPAAIAMQARVKMSDARIFFAEFYRTLLEEGIVDLAVNNGRRRLIENADDDNWSIPALFSRLREGRLWKTDPLRESVQKTFDDLPDDANGAVLLPIQAIEHTKGLQDYDPLKGASGPRFDLWRRMCDVTAAVPSLTIVSGGRGFLKSTQLRRLFRKAAERYLQGTPDAPVPVLLSIRDLFERNITAWPSLQRVWTGQTRAENVPELGGRQFLFLVDGDEEITGSSREDALEALKRLRAIPGSSLCIVAEEDTLSAFESDFKGAKLLVTQPLTAVAISSYLRDLKSDAANALAKQINDREHIDLACQPRFLQHMLEMAEQGMQLASKRSVLVKIAAGYLARINTTIPRNCIEDALGRIAWAIQNGRGSSLEAPQLFPLLKEARDGREFGLYDLKRALIEGRNLLVSCGDEGVRFALPPLQSYFAAQCLSRAPDQEWQVENITASLGRLARVRRWERVLTLLATMRDEPGHLLRCILAGSSLMEGEQLFLGVHCYAEAVADGKDVSGLEDVADQMTDSLLWRSAWDGKRTNSERLKSLQGLIALAVLFEKRRNDIIPSLVKLACDLTPVLGDQAGNPRYDVPAIRRLAATGAARFPDATTKYIKEQREDLVEPVEAWWQLPNDPKAMEALLSRDDPRVSVIAASALAQSGRSEDRDILMAAYSTARNDDVKAGIVDALSAADTGWIDEKVVAPWVKKAKAAEGQADLAMSEHICLLVGNTRFASDDTRSFLIASLESGSTRLQGKAMRALASLQDDAIEEWLRPRCEKILAEKDVTLHRAALLALRDIGDAGSLEIVRRRRTAYLQNCDLKQLSYQVAEEMYWRLTGGLNQESYTAPGSRR